MGTFATFQGFPLRDLRLERTRGYAPDLVTMKIPVAAFPLGFDFRAPKPGELRNGRAVPGRVVGTTRATADTPVGAAPLARGFDYEGFLVLREEFGSQAFELPPIRLFVVSVETARASNGGPALVEVKALDIRFHWDRGLALRHSYNRKRPDGTVALDSVKEDGTPVNRAEVAADVCSALFRRPRLARTPSDWLADTSSVQFVPNTAPVVHLAQLVTSSDLVEPCLQWDESIALYRPGEGKVGYAASPGAPNTLDFPPEVRLDKGGQGQADLVALTYPEDYCVVIGGLKVATVAVDDCPPVFDIDGATLEVNDENVRRLTGGRYDTAWLRKFVLLSADHAGAPDLPEPIARLFRTQAYQLWQVRDVERDVLADAPDEEGRGVRIPGPNAHILPVQPRAETTAGRRWQPTLETYTFAQRHQALTGGGANTRQTAAIRELERIKQEITRAAAIQDTSGGGNLNPATAAFGRSNPFAGYQKSGNDLTGRSQLAAGDYVTEQQTFDLIDAGYDVSDLEAAIQQARLVKRIADTVGSGFSQLYEEALKQRLAAEDEGNGTFSAAFYELAKEFLDLEERANDEGSIFDNTRDAFKDLQLDKVFQGKTDALIRQLRLAREERDRRRSVGGSEGQDVKAITVMVNVARTVDAGSRVYDAERGIFASGGLAGHLVTPNIHGLAHPDAQLSVCPVRAIFGAHVRPRLDVAYSTRPRPRTGADPQEGDVVGDCPGGDDVVPEALTNDESYFMAAFQRGPNGEAQRVPLSAVPRDEVLPIQRPDLVELISLDGGTNRQSLEAEAQKEAERLFKAKPVVRASKTTLGRLWPVQCDGLVEKVEIVMRQKDNAPCGFETVVYTGGAGNTGEGTREDPARRGAAALRAQNEAAKRERVS